MKQIRKIFYFMLIALVGIFATTATVQAEAPKTIELGSTTLHSYGLVAGVEFDYKVLKNGTYVYCMDYYKNTPRNVTMTLRGELDAGMAYLIANGYPNKSITGNVENDYYITQTAIWWYLDDTTGSSNLPSAFKRGENDPRQIWGYINRLVQAAKEHKNTGYAKTILRVEPATSSLSLSKNKDYYVSTEVTVSGSNLDETYIVSLKSGSEFGAQIVDTNLNAKTTFQVGEKFLVKVPVEKLKDEEKHTISVEIKATGTVNKAYEYASSDSSLQRIVSPVLQGSKEEKVVSATFNVQKIKKHTKVEFLKKDQSNNNFVEGAVLVLKDEHGNIVSEWTTKKESYVLDDLPYGTYTLEEKSAPEGYQLSTEKITFTLSDDHLTEVITMYNAKEDVTIDVPDTDTSSTIFYLLGASFVIGGLGLAIRHAKKA